MKKLLNLSLLLLMVLSIAQVNAQSKKNKKKAGYTIDNYEIECMGTGKDGTQLVKIWGYGKKPDKAIYQAKVNAVHGVIFKGIQSGKNGCMTKPLISDPNTEDKHAEYFEEFFKEGGKYLSFVSLSGEGVQDRVKIKKIYKVGIVVAISHWRLREELENAKIIKRLDSGF